MNYISHRVNTVAALANVSPAHGVELDLRDSGDRLILQHDPFGDGENFAEYLQHYRHGTMILNIKSERIEWRVLEELQRAGTVKDYFFLDSSYPMIRALVKAGERNVALRFSEYEPIENCLAMAGQVEWVWIDCFNVLPLDEQSHRALREAGFKLCIVSPELQSHDYSRIEEFARQIKTFPVDAICTKKPARWQQAFSQLG